MTEQMDMFGDSKNMQKVLKKQQSGKKVTQREALSTLVEMKGTLELMADDVRTLAEQHRLLEYRMDLLTITHRALFSLLEKQDLITQDQMAEQWQEELKKQKEAEKERAEELAKAQTKKQEDADAFEEVKRQSADAAYYKMLSERVEASDMDEDRKQYFQTLLQDEKSCETAAIELRKEGIDLSNPTAEDATEDTTDE